MKILYRTADYRLFTRSKRDAAIGKISLLQESAQNRQGIPVLGKGRTSSVEQNEAMLLEKLAYIHNNPVKRGYVDESVHWRYSSVRNYAGMEGLIPVYTQWWSDG